jgi:hypothetical protein
MRKGSYLLTLLPALALVGCGSSSGTSGASSITGTPAPAPVETSTPAPVTSRPAPVATSVPPATTQPPESSSFVMPNEVGKVLQDAQDDLQRVSGNPLYFSSSSDATGAGRHQILDRDWQVCSQSIAPGATVADSETPDFAVVRIDTETCP